MYIITKHDFYFESDSSNSDDEFEVGTNLKSKNSSLCSISTSDKSIGALQRLSSAQKPLVDSKDMELSEGHFNEKKFPNTGPNEKSGWLKKQSDNILKNWAWRFFILKDYKLCYYRKPGDSKLSGVLNFTQVSATLKIYNASRPTMLSILVKGLTYTLNLKSDSPNELQDWANHIQKQIDNSCGKIKEIALMSFGEKLWKHERVSEYFFKTSAGTGDLLLFRSKGLNSKIQRGLTGGKYDHVALILCYSSGKICLLEATHSTGVDILDWEDFIGLGFHLGVERIVYRSLKFERTEYKLQKLEEFIKRVEGKAYGLSMKKLLPYFTKSNPGDESDFFCSELVASAYKALEILPLTIASNTLLPGNFSEDKGLSLINAELGHEQVIDFDL